MTELATKALQSLVVVETTGRDGRPFGQASGFVARDGLIITNAHVIKYAGAATVRHVGSKTSYPVLEVVGLGIESDLCALRIEQRLGPDLLFAWAAPKVGDDIIVAGAPDGLEGTISRGIVSAIRPDMGRIQMDAAISPGSSGGPVLNRMGQVTGVAVSSYTEGQNLNFAIPSNEVVRLECDMHGTVRAVGRLAVSGKERWELTGLVRHVIRTEADISPVKPIRGIGMRQVESGDWFAIVLNLTTDFDRAGRVAGWDSDNIGIRHDTGTNMYGKYGVEIVSSAVNVKTGVHTETRENIRQRLAHAEIEAVSRSDHAGLVGTYDNFGRLTVLEHFGKNGSRETVIRYFYDDRGRLRNSEYLSDEPKHSGNHTIRYEYEDDEHGNWIIQYGFVRGSGDERLSSLVTRQIDYYER